MNYVLSLLLLLLCFLILGLGINEVPPGRTRNVVRGTFIMAILLLAAAQRLWVQA